MLTVKICILVRFDFERVCLLGPPEYVLIKSHKFLLILCNYDERILSHKLHKLLETLCNSQCHAVSG